MERSRSFFVTLGAAFPLRGTASIFSEIDMFDMIGYWGSATAACFSHKPKAKKPYVFILSRRLEEAVVGAICHHTIVAYLTQKELGSKEFKMSDWDFLHEMHDRGYSAADIADAAGCGYAPWEAKYVEEQES